MDTYKFEQNRTSGSSPINGQKTLEGFLLLQSNTYKEEIKKPGLIGHIIGYLFLIIIPIIILVFLIVFFWILPIIAVISLISAIFNKKLKNSIIARFSFSPPEVLLSSYPLGLGSECDLTFRRKLKKNRKTKQSGKLTFKLVCLERVEYKKGSDTEVEVNTIWESEPEVFSVPENVDIYSFKINLVIPNHLPPSFEGKNNQIRWIISVEQNIFGIVEQVYSNFGIVVDPVLLK